MAQNEKKYSQIESKDIKLVKRPSDLDEFDDDSNTLRAVLSCGHVTSADSLTDCCKAQLDRGETELKCPVCQKKWTYHEVRLLAKLTDNEQQYFDKTLGKSVIKNSPAQHYMLAKLHGTGDVMASQYFQIFIRFNDKRDSPLIVATSKEQFENTTIQQIKEKFIAATPGMPETDRIRAVFGMDQLDDKETVGFYQITHLSVLTFVMRMDGGSGS
ncbi:hypothetical protein Q8A67_006343 [Cirrhinus molitorella]|uniref:Ubiquitin-like domain-containing protein n=1 Tax=Cirrhinus molitorella TaxID=172907 RepID=A0AA88TTF2_9TELE|nr:hypothetical protein Q8A67_006343 [Cirrhinus molitorella]